jgi:undecaprenyl-diphosphatase
MNFRIWFRTRFSGRRELVLLASIIGIFVTTNVVFAIGHGVSPLSRQEFEENLLRVFRDRADVSQPVGLPELKAVGQNITALGSAIVLGTLSLAVAGYHLLRRGGVSAVIVILAYAGGYALSDGLKAAFLRGRPAIVPHWIEISSASFPSGHATVSAAVYFVLAALLARQCAHPSEKIYIFFVALCLVVAIGVSRVFLGVHYPTDVLAGWTLGSAWALACWFTGEMMWRRRVSVEKSKRSQP